MTTGLFPILPNTKTKNTTPEPLSPLLPTNLTPNIPCPGLISEQINTFYIKLLENSTQKLKLSTGCAQTRR